MRVTEQELMQLESRLRRGRLAIDMPTYSQPQVKSEPKKPATGKRRGVMNKWEEAYASEILEPRMMANEIKDWWYESIKLKLANGAWFCVDFFALMADGTWEAHEVKGHFREAAAVRIKVAANMYPFKFFIAKKRRKKDGAGWLIYEVV